VTSAPPTCPRPLAFWAVLLMSLMGCASVAESLGECETTPCSRHPASPGSQVDLVRNEIALDVRGLYDRVKSIVVVDLAVGPPGEDPAWSRTFAGDTAFSAVLSSGRSDYERAFGAAWCQVLRHARLAMDSTEFRQAFTPPAPAGS
jgi:hypothetical protein